MNYLVTNIRGFHTSSNAGTIPTGIFYMAERLNQLNVPFEFVDSLVAGDITEKDNIYLSFMLKNHKVILSTLARKVIIGGTGAGTDNIVISDDKELLQIRGAGANINLDDLSCTGEIEKSLMPKDVEMPHIPERYLRYIRLIHFNNGSGCVYGRCLFCLRDRAISLPPEITAKAICEIGKRYGKQVQLSLDGPSKQYLSSIADNILKITNKPYPKWGCSLMSHYADRDFLKHINRSGCTSVGIGLEYLDDQILHIIQKGSEVERYFGIISNLIDLEMYAHFCLINFDPLVPEANLQRHHNNLNKMLSIKYSKFSFSLSELSSNSKLDKALASMED